MKIINIYGGPGTGKSTLAAGLFYEMKKQGYKVELVTEFAKDLVYSGDTTRLSDQLLVFAEQHHRIFRLKNHVDYIITDSPINLSIIYNQDTDNIEFNEIVNNIYNSYKNINFFITRNDSFFQEYGRYQNLDQSKVIDYRILQLLDTYHTIYPQENNIDNILNIINYDNGE